MRKKKRWYKGDEFDGFVENPRFGQGPLLTGLNPVDGRPGIYLHWRSKKETRIPGTAIAADPQYQPTTYGCITHYFDERRVCRDCRRPFLFFAAEQKFWYENLQFPLHADCIRCPVCRKDLRAIQATRKCYEALVNRTDLSLEELFELIDALLTLIESRVFPDTQWQHVRQLLNRIPEQNPMGERVSAYRKRLRFLEGTKAK